jgi:hypothetical protein
MSRITKLGMTLALALAPMVGLKAGSAVAACYTGCTGTIGHKVCSQGGASNGWTQCVVPDGSHCEFGGSVCFG